MPGTGPAEGRPSDTWEKSHGNRTERTVTLHVSRCWTCKRGHLSQLPPVIKLGHDFPDESTMRMECVVYVIERASCKRCGKISAAKALTIPGTSLGSRALGFVEEYYAKRGTDETIAYFFKALYSFAMSPNTVWNARRALKNLLKDAYGEILDHIVKVLFVQLTSLPSR